MVLKYFRHSGKSITNKCRMRKNENIIQKWLPQTKQCSLQDTTYIPNDLIVALMY